MVLAAALGAPGRARDRALASFPLKLRSRLTKAMRWTPPGWRVVPVVGRRADAAEVVLEALPEFHAGDDPVSALLRLAQAEPCGLLLIIDEMGKLLEHAATGGGDAFFFQELAEAASRSEGRLVVIGVLHQAFDDYAYRLARETRDDWLKIQGRFVDLPLAPTSEEQVELLSRAIRSTPPVKVPVVDAVAAMMARGGQQDKAAARLMRCWPLNPVVACLLGPLSRRRFGQNQRSIFGFLGSAEPYGFQDFLRSTDVNSNALYDPVWLWSYLRANLEPSILASPDGHRWSTALDAVERVEERSTDELENSVLRTVALLDLFRERSGLAATPELIAAALSKDLGAVEASLDALVRRSAVVFRRHLGAYAIYAGSDFDIEAAIAEVRADVVSRDYGRLKATGVLSPVLAKREYHETGAMRWFEVDVATLQSAEERVAHFDAGTGAAGLFLLLINETGESGAGLRRTVSQLVQQIGERPIAFGISSDSYMLRELSEELVALERIQASRPELKGDAVARREVASRLARQVGDLEERLRSGLAATSWRIPALGTEEFKATGNAGLSIIASRMAAALYPSSPRIRNELLNRSKPSSNAMAAVRTLMTAMALRSTEPRLGIRDFPPEGGLYASILERTGLHGELENGATGFRAPSLCDNKHRLWPMWSVARDLLEDRGSEGVSLEDIFVLWRARPFGVKEGLLPILGLSFLLCERDRVSIYLDSVFCSSVSDLLVDRLLQDAAAVRLRISSVSERDAAILRGVADLVAEHSEDANMVNPDPLVIGRQLVALVMNSPGWVRRTSRLGKAALRVRDIAQAAHDPNKFMLDDLPRIAGDDASVEKIVAELRSGLEELASAYPSMLSELRRLLARELRVGESGFEHLRHRAKGVMGVTGNYRLDAFAARLSAFDDSREAIEGLASLAANRPPRDWVDRDADAARVELASLAREFLRAEGLVHVQGRGAGRFSLALFMSDPESGGLVTPDVTVDGEELVRARELATSLRAAVGKKVSREVALAASIELAAALAREIEDGERQVALAGGER
ncbi:hypothetical protein GCM10022280_18770 [Sphingomonas swuensis]|uniref:ATP-binding protein n=1 Tax=Sphingomonas swuensis TaxID=977800 RepID=A0ABP7T0R7_9SPHN